MKKSMKLTAVASFVATCTLFAGAGFANADGVTPNNQAPVVSPQIGFDKTNLRTEYNRVQAIANGNTAGTYKQSSWMTMHIDLDNAQKMLDDANDGNRSAGGAMSQSDVDTSTGILSSYPSKLQGAVSGEPTGADPMKTKADLQAFYNKVKDVQQSNYPGNSDWNAFKTARDSAGHNPSLLMLGIPSIR